MDKLNKVERDDFNKSCVDEQRRTYTSRNGKRIYELVEDEDNPLTPRQLINKIKNKK